MNKKLTTSSIIAVLALTGCGTVVAQPAPGYTAPRVIGIGLAEHTPTLASNSGMGPTQIIDQAIGRGLVNYRPSKNQIVPALAQYWVVNQTGTVFAFFLRPHLRFSDGTPVTAKDVADFYKWEMAHDQAMPPLFTTIKSIVYKGNNEVVFMLNQPDGTFLSKLADSNLFIEKISLILKEGKKYGAYGEPIVGTGPYRLVSFGKDWIVTKVNPYYYGAKPTFRSVRYFNHSMAKDATLIKKSLLQFSPVNTPNGWGPQYTVTNGGGPGIITTTDSPSWFAINMTNKTMANVKLREALALSVNKNEVVPHFVTPGFPSDFMVPSPIPGFGFEKQGGALYNLAKARTLLKKAGYPNGKGLTLTIGINDFAPSFVADCEIYARNWQTNLGIHVVFDVQHNQGAYYTNPQKLDMMAMGWGMDFNDAGDLLDAAVLPAGVVDVGYYDNTQVTALLNQANRTLNFNLHNQLYVKAQQIALFKDWAYIPYVQYTIKSVFNKHFDFHANVNHSTVN